MKVDDRAVVVDAIAPQQCPDELDRLADRACRLPALDPELGKSRNPGANAENSSLARNFVKRRDRHRGQRRVTRDGISHARAKA